MKKRVIFLALVLLCSILIFTACTQPSANTEQSGEASITPTGETSTDPEATEPYKVALLIPDASVESCAYYSKLFVQYGPEYNMDISVMDPKSDTATQAQHVTNCISQGVDAIIICPVDPAGVVPSLMAAKEAGIVVSLFSSDLPEESQQYRDFFCGADDFEAGKEAGEKFVEQFPDGANIVEIGGQPGHDAQVRRHDGFMQAIEGSNIKILETQNCKTWATNEAMNIMQDFITKYGEEIDGIFCHWDNGFTGCIQAMTNVNMDPSKIFSVAIDGCRGGFDQVEAGKQTITLMQNFDSMVNMELDLCSKVLNGETVDEFNYITWDVVDKDSIGNFPYPEW